MILNLIRTLWGDLSKAELKKFGLLSCIITIILGNYWMLRSMKNPIFNDLVGMQHQPKAKLLSIVVVILVLFVYSKLVDRYKKDTLFYIICTFYSALFMFVSIAAYNPSLFSLSETSSLFPYMSWIPGKLIGWISYFSFESSSLLMILFWAFVASITKPESAKKGYAMIVTCIQIGTISGPALVVHLAPKIGSPILVAFGSLLILTVPLLVKLFMKTIPHKDQSQEVQGEKKPKTGFLEGLKLIYSRPYVLAILVVSTAYEVVSTILEFQMHMIARDVYVTRDLYAAFSGKFGMSVNFLALIFALVGTGFFMRRLGFRFCLIAYPALIFSILLGILTVGFTAASQIQIMWVLFASIISIKGFSYALNNPTKEVMYIPTTKDIKYKAKGWIESFGGRSSKGTGALVTDYFASNPASLLLYGSILSLGIVGAWLLVANWLGHKFNSLQEENLTVS